jgi:hypothetical protein
VGTAAATAANARAKAVIPPPDGTTSEGWIGGGPPRGYETKL